MNSRQTALAESAALDAAERDFMTAQAAGQWFGVPAAAVQDVLGPQRPKPIASAPPEVAGSVDLHGRTVTLIDLRRKLGLAPADPGRSMSLVVEHRGALYGLLVDQVGEVLGVPAAAFALSPAAGSPWEEVSAGRFRLDDRFFLELDLERLLKGA